MSRPAATCSSSLPSDSDRFHAAGADADILRVLDLLPPILTRPLIAAQAVPVFTPPPTPTPGVWVSLGPAPIANGETFIRSDPVSGRVTAISVDPADANVAYVGTAQGGLYRTLDGGTTWTQMMDNAPASTIGTPLAIGALAISPDSQTVFVGTGEGNNNFDGAFGSGFYIIRNAKSSSPTINGPLNVDSAGNDAFAGRSITSIAIDPTNTQHIFCGTSFGLRGFYTSDASPARAPRGLYRSVDGGKTWTRLTVGTGANATVTSVALDPGNPNHAIVAIQGGTADAPGIYVSNNALSTDPANPPTFTNTPTHATPEYTFVKLALNGMGATLTVLAASGESNNSGGDGRLFKSNDGGATWTEITAARGFAAGQGFFNVAVAVDSADANKIYLGGSGADTFTYSSDGGTTFTRSITGLHPDTHSIAIAPSNSSVIYTGNDGGIWRSTNAGQDWTSLNNASFSATQFSDLALHPTASNVALGGTQDNGTVILQSDGKTFTRVDIGDGGYSLIDQSASATDTNAVTFYHTYYNRTGAQIGTARVLRSDCAQDFEWSFHGIYQGSADAKIYCDSTSDTFNGTGLSDGVNFYAPQALGPGNPNTWYFGTDRLYRSTDRASTAAVASQVFSLSINSIAVAPQNDNVRLVGLNDGRVFATTTGNSSLTQIAGAGTTNATPSTRVARIAVDPTNPDVAYLVFTGYGSSAAPIQHVWKTTNLSAVNSGLPVVFTAVSGTGASALPDVSANAIAIDPENSGYVYIGTDIGVFRSIDAGATWTNYSVGLPNVAVFGLQLQSANRVLRAATHGRGLYEVAVGTPPTPTPTPIPTSTPTPTPSGTPVSTPSPSGSVSPTPSTAPNANARALNISTRLDVGVGENQAIGGFIITGTVSKRVIVRAIGPSLAQAGVSDALADPVLELHGPGGALITSNDDWRDTDATQIAATGIPPTDDHESALIATLAPGNYTAIMSGKNGTTGVGLVEAYDLDGNGAASSLANISTRGVVQTDGKVVIGGFILGSAQSGADILIRGLGPSLAQQGVLNAVDDTTLELRDSHGALLVANDNWQDDVAEAASIRATGIPPQDDREAAIVATLAPGAYTAILAGKNGAAGVGIVEIYNLSH